MSEFNDPVKNKQIDAERIAARIAARKALGLSAEQMAAKEKADKQEAIRNALWAGLHGSAAEIDSALAECRRLGVA